MTDTAPASPTPAAAAAPNAPPAARAPERSKRSAARSSQRRVTPLPPSGDRVLERRYRQTIRKVDLWSVLKISLCFYLAALVVFLGASMLLWWIGRQLGVIDGIQNFLAQMVSEPTFQLLSWRILRAVTLIGMVVVCLLVVLTVLAAALYNVFAQMVGGVEITVAEEETTRG
jgi:uncharacterized membrane protein